MTTKSDRRDAKRRAKEKSKRMRGNRWIFLTDMLRRNRYHKTGTIEDELWPAYREDEPWAGGGSFAAVKPGVVFPQYVRRDVRA